MCHTVALTSMRLSQRRQPFSALVCRDSVLDNGPNYRQMHHQRPAKQQKKLVIQSINSFEPLLSTYRCVQNFFDLWCAHMNGTWFAGRCENGTIFTQSNDDSSTAQTQKIIYCTFRFSAKTIRKRNRLKTVRFG